MKAFLPMIIIHCLLLFGGFFFSFLNGSIFLSVFYIIRSRSMLGGFYRRILHSCPCFTVFMIMSGFLAVVPGLTFQQKKGNLAM